MNKGRCENQASRFKLPVRAGEWVTLFLAICLRSSLRPVLQLQRCWLSFHDDGSEYLDVLRVEPPGRGGRSSRQLE
jgi:hypothetical protein